LGTARLPGVADQSDVKVFISWSGGLAKDVAIALRGWLPLLFDRVTPWASDTDIAAGQRGLAQIELELTNTRFGIVVVTAENQHAAWLNFEAGALSKVVGDVEHRVVPLLVDLAGPAQLTGPLAQFQAKTAQKAGMLSLVCSLAAVAEIHQQVATARFEAYWPQLEEKIEKAVAGVAAKPTKKQEKRDVADVLDEILLHVRALRSDGESSGVAERAARRAGGFRRFLDGLAAENNLKVDEYPEVSDTGERAIFVSPTGEFSQADIDAFKDELRKRAAPRDRDITVSYVPF